MSKTVTYSCDICREECPSDGLVGLDFSSLRNFKFETADAADGVHICLGCLHRIDEQMALHGLRKTEPA